MQHTVKLYWTLFDILTYLDKSTYVFISVGLDIFLELPSVFIQCDQSLHYFYILKKEWGAGGWRERNEKGESNWEERGKKKEGG